MKKRIISIAIVFVMLFSFAFAASANSAHIFDIGTHLTESEMSELEVYAQNIENNYGYCVMFCITDSITDYDTTYEFAENFYTTNANAENGALFVYNRSDEDYTVYLAGEAETIFTEAAQNAVWNAYNDEESYFSGIEKSYTTVEDILSDNGVSINNTTTTATTAAETTTAMARVERTLPLVVDNANILTDAQEKEFNEKFNTFTEEYEMEIAFVTVTSLDGKTAQDYADDFYDKNGYGYGENNNCLILLYLPGKEGERELSFTAYGDTEYKISEEMVNTMLLEIKDDIISGDYSAALDKYIAKATEYVKPGVNIIWLFVFILAGCVIALFVLNGMAAANKSVIRQADAKVYVRSGSLVLTGRNDTFKGSYVNKDAKVDDSNSAKTSTHTSSSGKSHSGGSIKF